MSIEQVPPLTLPANADLSASQFCAVDINASGRVVVASAGGRVIGVLYTKPTLLGMACTVESLRGKRLRMKYGGTVTAGDTLKTDASGRFVTAVASDIAAGAAVAVAAMSGVINDIGSGVLLADAGPVAQASGFDDIVLSTTAPSATTETTFVQTTGTQSKALAAGAFVGQKKRFIQSVAAATPVGTITGTFLTQAGAAATTLALGTAVATIADFIWTGAAWRLTSAVTGTASSLT